MRAMAAAERPAPTVPRGRHAPPLEVRLSVQRRRLFEAAADVFARVGYADASAEAISREAGMSKATFYEHFANKEECILALTDAAGAASRAAVAQAGAAAEQQFEARVHARVQRFLKASLCHLLQVMSRSDQGSLIHQIGQVGTHHANSRGGNHV